MADKNDLEARFAELAARNAQLMAALEAKLDAPASGGISADQLEAILTRATASASKTSEMIASKIKPENVDHLQMSPFEHPEGGIKFPKPELVRETFIYGGRLRKDELTYWEVEAVNRLNASLNRSQRRVTHDGKWVAQVSDDDGTLLIRVPVKTIDDRADLPPMLQILQELTSGERTQDVGEMATELALLKSQVAKLTEGLPTAAV
jgi:hypothetical protein